MENSILASFLRLFFFSSQIDHFLLSLKQELNKTTIIINVGSFVI